MKTTKFTKEDTSFIKGITISLMLIHHLFPIPIPTITVPIVDSVLFIFILVIIQKYVLLYSLF